MEKRSGRISRRKRGRDEMTGDEVATLFEITFCKQHSVSLSFARLRHALDAWHSILKPREIRDAVAFLAELKPKAKKTDEH